MSKSISKNKFTLVLAISSLSPSGAEHQFLLLARSLFDLGVSVHVCTLYAGKLDSKLGAIPHFCLFKKGRWDWRFLLRYFAYVKALKPDVIYAFMPEMNVFSALVWPNVIFGLRSSDIQVHELPFWSRIYFYAQKFFSSHALAIICNSQHAIGFYGRYGYEMQRAFVIQNGIDTQYFTPSNGHELRLALQIPIEAFVIGIGARMDRVKDYPLLARVAKAFLARYEDVYFVAIGKIDDAILRSCQSILGCEPRFLFLGFQQDPKAYYAIFDCIFCSSYTEGFSNSIAEAMACGCLPVVSDVGDNALIANFGQSYDFVFAPKDKKGALVCLESLYAQRAHLDRLREQARIHICSHFGLSLMVQKTWRLIEGLCQRL